MGEHDATALGRLRIVSWILAASPAILVALFLTLGVHVRLGLGHWPMPMWENYDTAAYNVHELLFTGWLLFALFGAAPIWLGCVLLGWRTPGMRRVFAGQLLALVSGCALVVATVALDPTRFVEWFMD